VDNNERAAAASNRAVVELERFADELRQADIESVDVSTGALDAENERLHAIISLRRTALEKVTTDRKAADDQLCQLQAINDQMKKNYFNSHVNIVRGKNIDVQLQKQMLISCLLVN